MGQFTFRKEERLKKEKDIQELFSKGSSFYLFPFKVLLLATPQQTNHQVLISVSKKNFPRAVDRNLLKRRIREAYRIEKGRLPAEATYRIGLIFTHKEILAWADISEKMVHVLKRIKRIASESVKQQ
jgi:ribonuclease P protein component